MYHFKGNYKGKDDEAGVNLFLIHFKNENDVHFIYSSRLDITGYGYTLEDAKESFGIVFEDFIDYTLKKKTLGDFLTELGWEVKDSLKRPSITLVISENKHVSEIFDQYPRNSFYEKAGIPF